MNRLTFLYHKLRSRYFWDALNYSAKRYWLKNHNLLNALGERLASDLKKDGIAMCHIKDLPIAGIENFFNNILLSQTDKLWSSPEVQASLPAKIKAIEDRARSKSDKHFFVFLNDDTKLDLEESFAKFNLNPFFIEIIAKYLGSAPKFNSLSIRSTLVVPPDYPPLISQNWHRDPEDKKMIKVFTYLTDVDEGSGPFIYVKGSQYGGKYANVYPQKPPVGVYPPKGEVEKLVDPADIITCVAPKGTIILADTAGLHKGGFSTTNRRVMSIASYVSSASIQKPRFASINIDGLSPLVKYAVK